MRKRGTDWAVALVLGLALWAPATGAVAQQAESEIDTADYSDQGFYQSYVFGAPDDPSEAWQLAYGGRLYDAWWAVLFRDPPEESHPAYPREGLLSGSATWRCVECHGWDYRGAEGRYGEGPHYTGIKGIDGMAGADPERIAAILRNDTHRYSPELLPDKAVAALALFVSRGQIDTATVIEPQTGLVQGDVENGKQIFQNVCAICHDFDGQAWITGDEDQLTTLGAIATANPWRGLHKIMNGQTYADMPALRAFGPEVVRDVLSYIQTLPPE